MPVVELNGIRLSYQVTGSGELVVLVMGTGSPGRVWHLHQVPALVAAGYRVATVDNRGIPPSDECPGGITIDDLVGDIAALIEYLGNGPARVVGTSLGARIVQELALARPDLVAQAVMMAAHGRTGPVQTVLSAGERALYDDGIELPPKYYAAITALLNLSPRTLNGHATVQEWLDVLEFSGSRISAGVRAQLEMDDFPDRLAAYSTITVPSLVIGFADDLMTPPYLAREVAEAIPEARYEEISGCGHFGYLERPDEVNKLLFKFFAST
ncbi:MAG: alpha/beta hydrolase [Actinomycetota bacterium]|nr:alpha/beta hydrolase [Actinomycetota bacterium]MDQ3900977.1 alpha/beta hydrolase [Actinomycetota bacterium]